MVEWFLPFRNTLEKRIPSDTEIITALEALLSIASPDELQDVLVKWQSVLYSETTLITVCITVAQERVTGHTQCAVDLQDFLTMLEYTRKKGIAAAMQIVMSMANEANSQDVVPEIDDEASAIPFPRHIELLTKAIACVSQENHADVWAQLHNERADALRQAGNYEQAIEDYTVFLDICTYEAMPDEWFNAHGSRGVSYLGCVTGNPTQNLTLAIADFDACLEKMPQRDTYHVPWANLHRFRGVAYSDYHMLSNYQEHIERAISDFNAALEVFTREDTPYEWALAHINRGAAYKDRSHRELADNIELAIAEFDAALEVFTRKDTPEEWADTLLNRGLAYTERMHGEGVQNVEQAIADLNRALEVFTRETNPYKYAVVNLNLGFAYTQRLRESRAANLERAMKSLDVALELLTPEANPLEWAAAHLSRGYAYMNYPLGERANNLEMAIRDCDSALTIYTRESRPIDWAKAGLNRTLAYTYLMSDYYKENLDYANNDYNAILEVLTKEETPRYWAIARMNRGIVYLHRSLGAEAENIELAIADFNAALSVFNRETTFQDWVLAHLNRGLANSKRIAGNIAENLDQAIADYDSILTTLSQEQMPYFWAMTCKNRAAVYLDSINGDPAENLQQVIADSKAAMAVLTRETAPREYRDLQLMLAQVYEQQGRWQEACSALQESRKTTRMLIEAAATEERRREAIGERDKSSIHLRYAQALLRCEPPDVTAAVCVLEEGRAQNLRSVLELDEINLQGISNPSARARAETFIVARDAWQRAQQLVTDMEFINLTAIERSAEYLRRRPQLNAAHAAFIQARDAIRRYDDPNFLVPEVTLEDIGRATTAPGAAIVYLAAGEHSGLALVVMRTSDNTLRVEHISLPGLTRKAVIKLLMGADELPRMKLMQTLGGQQEVPFLSGGLWLAQLSQSFEMLTMWGENIYEAMRALPIDSTFLDATQQLISGNVIGAEQRAQLDRPFAMIDMDERLALGAIFSNLVINAELKRSLPVLAALGLHEVARKLQTWNMQDITLIPYGYLSFFPLPAVPIQQLAGTTKRLSDLFTVTVTPSARAKEMALSRASAVGRSTRPLLLTVGNPHPLPEGISSLPYAQAEADTIRRMAEAYHYQSETIRYFRLQEAAKEDVVKALEQAWYAHLAIHGQYDPTIPRHSRLVLAGNESLRQDKRNIYLSEALDGMVNLVGLRLLVLSACETALIDTSYAPDEVLGLAAGFLQAGAAGVIASLWAVDDHATYLLMSRFAQFYLDPQRTWSPARALAEAQRWLREEATNKVLMTYDPVKEIVAGKASTQVQSEGESVPANSEGEFAASGLRSLRYSYNIGLAEVHSAATIRALQEPDALPFADPVYWAAFVVTGC